ncbi:MAG TPA: CmcI family methyltransferase [Allosphingosinicella sp.]|jgi:cephalosporin hydroxylase
MKTIIDEERALITVVAEGGGETSYPMASAEGFAAASRAWLRAGWDAKHVYSFTWMGRPVIQLPEDLVRIQELIWAERPDVIVETGIAHGGSLVFFASLFQAIGNGRVVGVDIDIRPHNRAAIEAHPLAGRIALVEASSTSPEAAAAVAALVGPGEKAMVVLDSNHSRAHVLAELRLYAPLVPVGGYVIVEDGIVEDLAGAPRSAPDWAENNPQQAVRDFLAEDDRFELVEPEWPFNEGLVRERVTYWPSCHLKRIRR